ncbi:MAG: hypothetical protein OEQ29_20520 [Alphaproteobacteria bacterium]|nr:hypothetical protein [Alphaproteobacteria bacterium]
MVVLLVAASYAGKWIMGELTPQLTPSTEPALHRLIMTAIAIYVLLIALPFVPGVEIGLAMMVMFGPKIAPLVYGATVLALVIAFLFGRLIPQRAIIEIFETLRLRRAGRLLRAIEPLDPDQRLQHLVQNAPGRIVPFLLRNRLVALVLALNIPGNSLVGGGGGICLAAGFSRLFVFPKFALAVAIAVLPIPLMVLVSGS